VLALQGDAFERLVIFVENSNRCLASLLELSELRGTELLLNLVPHCPPFVKGGWGDFLSAPNPPASPFSKGDFSKKGEPTWSQVNTFLACLANTFERFQ
jgi:hypothetical protein